MYVIYSVHDRVPWQSKKPRETERVSADGEHRVVSMESSWRSSSSGDRLGFRSEERKSKESTRENPRAVTNNS